MESTDPRKTTDLTDLWMKTYQATYGRLLEMQPVGPFPEKYKTTMDTTRSSLNLYGSWMEMVSSFQIVFMEGMRRLRIKLDEVDIKDPMVASMMISTNSGLRH